MMSQKKNECDHKSGGTFVRIDGSVNKYTCSVCDVVFYRPKSYGNYPVKYRSYVCHVNKCKSGGVLRKTRPNGQEPVWWCKTHLVD